MASLWTLPVWLRECPLHRAKQCEACLGRGPGRDLAAPDVRGWLRPTSEVDDRQDERTDAQEGRQHCRHEP
jgi:hypothetical protein